MSFDLTKGARFAEIKKGGIFLLLFNINFGEILKYWPGPGI